MALNHRTEKAERRRGRPHPPLARPGQSELGWVAALLVVAVLVAMVSVGGPVWQVLVSGSSILH